MTSRTTLLRDKMLSCPPTLSSERMRLFTESLKSSEGAHIKLRMARAFAHVLENISLNLEPGELIVGSLGPAFRSCQIFPEYSWTWIDKELEQIHNRKTEPFILTQNDIDQLRQDFSYWKGKSIAEISATKMPKESILASKAGLFTIGAPGTGIGHVIVDYERVLNKGLRSLLTEVEEYQTLTEDPEKSVFYDAVKIQIEAVIKYARRFSAYARKLAKNERDPTRREELLALAEICRNVPENPAQTFHEALQSFWFIHLLVQTESNGHSISTGRFDQYLYPFYRNDLKNEVIDRDGALELLEMLWIKFASIIKLRNEYYSIAFAGYPMFQNLTVGGQDADGNDASNDITDLVLDATVNMRVTQPTVSFRWHKGMRDDIKLRVAEVIAEGLGMPGLFNDEIIIPMMIEKGVDREEAYNYSILGCVEPIISGKTDARPNIGFVNLPKVLEVTLNNGVDPRTGIEVGVATGDPREFKSFDDLWYAFTAQLDYSVELLTCADHVAAQLHAEMKPTPFTSSLLSRCLQNGLTMQEGGAKYNAGGIQGVGIATVTDSLAMIRKYVFEKKDITMDNLLLALCDDFVEHESLRARLDSDAEKYGNDIKLIDEIARDVGVSFSDSVQSRVTTRSGNYHSALFSVSMYIPQGETVGATPDGRKSGVMLSDGVSPGRNREMKGPTAAMRSVARIDHGRCYNGTLYNMKFTPQYLASLAGRYRFVALIDGYFKLGGFHVQFNIVSRETLEDAKIHPEQHRNLIVRVAGYSAYFIELDPYVQDEVIARTEFSSSMR